MELYYVKISPCKHWGAVGYNKAAPISLYYYVGPFKDKPSAREWVQRFHQNRVEGWYICGLVDQNHLIAHSGINGWLDTFLLPEPTKEALDNESRNYGRTWNSSYPTKAFLEKYDAIVQSYNA